MPSVPHATVAIVRSSEDGKASINILHYTIPAGVNIETGAAAAGRLVTEANTAAEAVMKNVTPEGCRYEGVAVRVSVGGQSFVSERYVDAGPGLVPGDTCPNYVSIVMPKRTATAGRSGRGRWYLGCVPESFTDGPRVAAAASGPLVEVVNLFKATFETTDGGWVPRHYSPKTGQLLPIVHVTWTGKLGILQRRRLRPTL